jgi:SAM-dependent methyltransferase
VPYFITDTNASILICGGGMLDKTVFELAGYQNVTISNIDSRMQGNEYAPFKWAFENAASLTYENNAFDYVVIHAAIHHSSTPHKVLTEMYRVAKKGVLCFEARDSAIMRLMEWLKLVQVYEHAAVFYNDCKYGGVDNTEIPNFIYRWTEREIEKTIKAYAPYALHNFYYKYGTSLPCTPETEKKGQIKYILLKILQPFFWLFTKIFKKQQNLFSFFIEKPKIPDALFPWLYISDKDNYIVFNKSWAENRYV